jgi:diguanylate cyclase (GGDEF)-like protein
MSHLKSEDCLDFFSEVLNILKASHEPERVSALVVDRLVRMYGCQTCAIVLIDTATEYLRIFIDHNLSHQFVKNFKRSLGTGALARMLSSGTPLLLKDGSTDVQTAEEVRLEHPLESAVCLQISAEFRTLGYLHLDAREANAFGESDLRVLQSFADLISLTLNKSYLYEKNLRLDPVDHETDLDKYAPFLERLSAGLSRAETNKEDLSLFMLDIDNYKQIGGTYGYEASKRLLREVAGIVKKHLRPRDAASRYGFDEIIVMREGTPLDEAMRFADELRRAIDETEFTQQKIHSTVSIGVASYSQRAATERELLLAAKEALYEAQRSGRNKIVHV